MSCKSASISEAASRLERTKAWDANVSRLRYASAARAQVLEHMGLVSVHDVLSDVPRRYLDFTKLSYIAYAEIGSEATIVGRVDRVKLKRPKPRLQLVEVSLVDETGVLVCAFFKQPWLAEQLKQGDMLAVSGKVEFNYGFKRMRPTFHEAVSKVDAQDEAGADQAAQYARILPLHALSEGMSAAWMRRIVSSALADYGDGADYLPAGIVSDLHLMSEARALRTCHFPPSLAAAARARKRLAFDELFCLQIALLSRRVLAQSDTQAHVHKANGPYLQALLSVLPFELTEEQKQAAREVLEDMKSTGVMNRLLLGDVGTGKTAVAAVALAAVADSGFQAAVMAPTSVLARQYAEKLGPLFDKAGITWALITGATDAAGRKVASQKIASGEIVVVFGTTALLSEDISFHDLSLVVVDEQHRFGVNQRMALRIKGQAADQLVMTATPIPRTLALSFYGDLDCSRITQRPHATAGITTKLITPENVDLAHTTIAEALDAGHQAYVVCPLVDDTDDGSELDDVPESERTSAALHSAQATYERLSERVFKDARVGLIHGRMNAAQKDQVMADFRSGAIQILVSTTVIEVGVDVPNATVMLIWDADRFGLATLHQLRGRVGRGTVPGMVYLVSAARGASDAAKRLRALEKTSDGLELAEKDLQLRHEGEVLGLRQSGGVTLKLVDVVEDRDLIEQAHVRAHELVQSDPALEDARHRPLAHEVRRRFGSYFEGERKN